MGLLRLLLALAVVSGHTKAFHGVNMIGPDSAVQVFFVISGFYIGLILDKKYNQIWTFYSNRYLRLFPAYGTALVLTIAWYMFTWAYIGHRPPPLWISEAYEEMGWWQSLPLRLSILTMIGLDIPSLLHWKSGDGFLLFHYGADKAPDGANWVGWMPPVRQAWSIGAEIWFYLLAPFLVKQKILVQATIALCSLLLMSLMNAQGIDSYFFFPANLWMFVAGTLLFKVYQSVDYTLSPLYGRAALVFTTTAVLFGGYVSDTLLHNLLLVCVTLCVPILFTAFSKSKLDTLIGNLSYPIYLFHVLVAGVLAAVGDVQMGEVVAAVTVIVAFAFTKIVEDPVDRYRQWRVQRVASIRSV